MISMFYFLWFSVLYLFTLTFCHYNIPGWFPLLVSGEPNPGLFHNKPCNDNSPQPILHAGNGSKSSRGSDSGYSATTQTVENPSWRLGPDTDPDWTCHAAADDDDGQTAWPAHANGGGVGRELYRNGETALMIGLYGVFYRKMLQ